MLRIADHAALGAAERNVDHRALPGHPGGQRAHFVQRHVGRVADAALGRAARDGMLHAIAGEDFEPAVVELHRDVNGDFLGGRAQHLAHAVVQLEPRRRPRRSALRRRARDSFRSRAIWKQAMSTWPLVKPPVSLCQHAYWRLLELLQLLSESAGSRCASTSSPFSTPNAWLKISVLSAIADEVALARPIRPAPG